MNPKVLLTLWSFRKELKYVLLAFLTILMVPVIGVILLTQVGINIISDKLVQSNPTNQTIQIKNPTSGEVVKEIKPQVAWPARGVITLEFGETSLYQVFHTGIDIAGPFDQPINPAMDDKVIYAGEIFWGYGKHIIIDNGNNITTVYAHLDKIYVYPGEKVTVTDTIGLEGQTGWATGPHLHFETKIYGIPVNPRVFLGYGSPD